MQHEHAPNRDQLTDILRGLGVLFMVTAHGIFFFHNGSVSAFNSLERALNVCTLTLFVFISGMAASKQSAAHRQAPLRTRILKTAKYAFSIYLVYAAVTIAAVVLGTPQASDSETSARIVRALALISPVNFTEYMVLFFILPLIALAVPGLVRKSGSSFVTMSLTGLASYALGLYLFRLNATGIPGAVKSLFAGDSAGLRFPVLFYLPVYLFGTWWETHAKPKYVLFGSVISLCFFAASMQASIPLLSPDVRWPPSIGFLFIGSSVAMLLYFVIRQSLEVKRLYPFHQAGIYIGKDALDFWISHLLLLFLYRHFIQTQYGDPVIVSAHLIILFVLSAIISSIGLTNSVSYASLGPVVFAPAHPRRFRKRYVAILGISAILLFYAITQTKTDTLYGSRLPSESFGTIQKPNEIRTVTLSSPRTWYGKRLKNYGTVIVSADARDGNNNQVPIRASDVSLFAANQRLQPDSVSQSGSGITALISASRFPSGTHALRMSVNQHNAPVFSNTVTVSVTEPLLVAWTFDWEGWEVSPDALAQIESLRRYQKELRFSHFVNPRMFFTSSMTPDQRSEVHAFLRNASETGDEIALHIHMQYDLVESAGVQPKKNTHWGLRSSEGYDVPTSEYTPAEFSAIVMFAKTLLNENGFPEIAGYRAGGWYLTGDQLQQLPGLGFRYDSSGRNKAVSGAFKNTPWNLSVGEQPYYPDPSDQNKKSESNQKLIMEIPNNALTTYESTSEELASRIRSVYAGGVLTEPKELVYVSHPQFASREFSKIAPVMDQLRNMSLDADSGPVFFTTTGEIYSLWKSYLH